MLLYIFGYLLILHGFHDRQYQNKCLIWYIYYWVFISYHIRIIHNLEKNRQVNLQVVV
jgi:hypothetical protein